MKCKFLSSAIAMVLICALIVGMLPCSALAAQLPLGSHDDTDVTVQVAAQESGATPDIQDGISDVSQVTEPRSWEELAKLDGVELSEEGALISITSSAISMLSDEELGLLLCDNQATGYTNNKLDANRSLRDQFGLTDAEIEQGVRLYGGMLAYTNELGDLAAACRSQRVDDEQVSAAAQLISAGYRCQQALGLLTVQDILGVSSEDLKREKVLECTEAEQADIQTADEFADACLWDALGLPQALIATAAKQMSQDAKAETAGILELPYPEEPSLMSAAANTDGEYYAPKEVLGAPYSYDEQGDFRVNVNTGAYSYTETDLSIPGRNGLDLVLTRQYHSDRARAVRTMGCVGLSWNETEDSKPAFEVRYRWYTVTPGAVLKYVAEITNYSEYTFNGGMPAGATTVTRFAIDEYMGAVAKMQSMVDEYIYGVRDSKGNTHVIALVPTITAINPKFQNDVFNLQTADNYLVDEFGLGHGWMLGLSHLERVPEGFGDLDNLGWHYQLTTSEGVRYHLESDISTIGSYIVDYTDTDLVFHLCTNGEYAGATYGLYHADGKTEYFDSNGRNIAIVDRYGNKIAIAYSFSDSAQKQVSKIQIVDTLGNVIVYEKVGLDASTHKIGGKAYNGLWKLTLNSAVIRKYYTYTQQRNVGPSASPTSTTPTQLIAVENEAGEVTYYRGSIYPARFNSYLRPANRAKGYTGTLYSNDGYDLLVAMSGVTYPNGGESSVLYDTKAETWGYNGYRHSLHCTKVTKMNSGAPNVSSTPVAQYTYGDFDNLEGLQGIEGKYHTEVSCFKYYPPKNASAATTNSYQWGTNKYQHTFDSNGRMTQEIKTSLSPIPGWQEDLLESDMEPGGKVDLFAHQSSWEAQVTQYEYKSADARRPSVITVVSKDPSSGKQRTQTARYTYDTNGNILTHTKPNGQTDVYTYDSRYNLLLSATQKQNQSTTIKTQNTLTSDGKSVASTQIISNNAVVSKRTYQYDSTGQMTAKNDYLSADSYATTSYTYGAQGLPTQVSVTGVKTASGTSAAGTPGFAAGTIVTKQTYNSRGWLTSQTDANGKVTSYSYDAVGRLTKVVYPDGQTQMYSYSPSNNTVTFTDEAGNRWLCTYGKSGKLQTVKDLTSNQMLQKNVYDQLDFLVKKTVFGGTTPSQTTYYRYDSDNRLIEESAVDGMGTVLHQELYTYQDGAGKITKTVTGDENAPSMVSTSYYDVMGNQIQTGRILDGKEYTDTYTYDYLGNQIQVRSAYTASLGNSYTVKNTYDYAGRLLSTQNTLGQTAYKTYDWLGNQLTDTNPQGNVTRYTYDVLGRLLRTSAPLDTGRTMQTDYTYDANGNVIQEKTLAGTSASTSRSTYYEYDNRGRLVLTKGNAKLAGTSGTDQYRYTQYTYDARGNILRVYTGLQQPLTISAAGAVTANGDSNYSVTKYTYDRYSRVTSQVDALNQTERFNYDINGNLTSQVSRKGITTYHTYDAMGRLVQSEAGADTISFSYTATNQRRAAASNGDTTTYTYDALGRLVTEVGPWATKTFRYNIGDLRTGFTVVANGTTQLSNSYSYNALGRLTSLNGNSVTANYTYDTNGNLATTKYGNNTTAAYTYNQANLPTMVQNYKGSTSSMLSKFQYTYGLEGNQLTKTELSGAQTSYTYDGLNRLSLETRSGGATNSYTYDDSGNRQRAILAGVSTSYSYDKNNRLLSTSGGGTQTTCTYDAQGNQTKAAVTGGGTTTQASFEYDSFNRLTSIVDNAGKTVYTYDADGLRSSKTNASGRERYVYDGDQLVVTLHGGEQIFHETFETAGQHGAANFGLKSGSTYYAQVNGTLYSATAYTIYVLDEDGPIELFSFGDEELEPEIPPVPVIPYVVLEIGGIRFEARAEVSPWEPDMMSVQTTSGATVTLYDAPPSSQAPTVYVRGLSLVASRQGSVTRYYHYNAHGDVVQLTDASGAVVQSYSYDAFGVESTPSTDANPFRYCGEQRDPETGNYYLRARYYSPATGRFTQEDTVPYVANDYPNGQTLIDPLSLNLYTYCANDPVQNHDPSGHITGIEELAAVVLIYLIGGAITSVLYKNWVSWVNSEEGKLTLPTIDHFTHNGYTYQQEDILEFTTNADLEGHSCFWSVDESLIEMSPFYLEIDILEDESNFLFYSEHTSKKRKSTKGKHEKGNERRLRDWGGEKGDLRRKPNPNKHRGQSNQYRPEQR